MSDTPKIAMVLAAGLGKRMRPITEMLPKPLVKIAGKALIDWGLDSLVRSGVETAVANVHYLPDQLIQHLAARKQPAIIISDERDALLDSGGGIVRALPLLGDAPFYILNADTFWIDRADDNLRRLALAWDGAAMDILLMLATLDQATGHSGGTDFLRSAEGRLTRSKGAAEGLIYAGAAIVHPRIFADAPQGPHSFNLQFDKALATGRLFGLPLDGDWITVGTPDAIAPAEAVVARAGRTAG
jgi:MurNAc alpha-1-phosphate uridylyltransferase